MAKINPGKINALGSIWREDASFNSFTAYNKTIAYQNDLIKLQGKRGNLVLKLSLCNSLLFSSKTLTFCQNKKLLSIFTFLETHLWCLGVHFSQIDVVKNSHPYNAFITEFPCFPSFSFDRPLPLQKARFQEINSWMWIRSTEINHSPVPLVDKLCVLVTQLFQ